MGAQKKIFEDIKWCLIEKKISVIVPVYNDEKRIGDCIRSLISLDYPKDKYEILVVDNNSTDNTPKIIKQHPIKYILEKKQSSYAARNAGAKQARGEILVFIDSDCIASRNWLIEIEKSLNSENIDGVMGLSKGINRNMIAEAEQNFYEKIVNTFTKNKYLSRVDTRNFAVKRSSFIELGGFDENLIYFGDAEFGSRLQEMNYSVFFNKKAVVKHINRTSLNKIIKEQKRKGKYFSKIIGEYPKLIKIEPKYHLVEKITKKHITKMIVLFALNSLLSLSKTLLPILIFLNLKRCMFEFYRITVKASFYIGVLERHMYFGATGH